MEPASQILATASWFTSCHTASPSPSWSNPACGLQVIRFAETACNCNAPNVVAPGLRIRERGATCVALSSSRQITIVSPRAPFAANGLEPVPRVCTAPNPASPANSANRMSSFGPEPGAAASRKVSSTPPAAVL